MFGTVTVAAACGVQPVTLRSWMARAPGFTIGRYAGQAKEYQEDEALTFVIVGELMQRAIGSPHELFPLAQQIARGSKERTVWVRRADDGTLVVSHDQPAEPTVALPLPSLIRRLSRSNEAGMRVGRMTR